MKFTKEKLQGVVRSVLLTAQDNLKKDGLNG
jgi:hypothetical protein